MLLSKEGVLLAFLTEQVKLSKYAIFTICAVTAVMTVAFLLKHFAGRYTHIKSLAESFLSAVDIKGVLKDTVTEYVKTKCKTEKKRRITTYAPFYGARYGDDFKSSASAPRNGALL